MFNLFNSKKAPVDSTEGVPSKYPDIVNEIHNEFLTAGDKILQEANKIIAESKNKSIDKGKRLAALGFGKCPEAVEAISTEQKIMLTKNVADLVQYYLVNYPAYKFITESMVKSICEKYGLVCGSIDMYKGFVPENKLSVIENFCLNKSDKAEHYFDVNNDGRNELPRYFVTEHDLTDYGKKYLIELGAGYAYITNENGLGVYSIPIFTTSCLDEFKGLPFVEVRGRGNKKGFQICAPAKDMEIPPNKKVVGHRIQNIPDPVVLQPVKGGYLIVAAWGNEASDEIVVNEINN